MDKRKNKFKKNKNDYKQNNKDKDKDKEDKDDEEYDILESVGLKSIYYNDQVQRYFSKYYINKGQPNEQYIFIHSNGIIMCGLGSNNDILKKNIKEIISLKQLSKITGRNKHGAHILCANENIIQIKTDDDTYNFCPQLKGKLLEINQNLTKNPKLLVESPEKNGFICLIQQEPNDVEALKEKLGKPENLIIKFC